MQAGDNPHGGKSRRPPIGAKRRAISLIVLITAIAATAAYKYHEKTRPRIVSGPMVQLPAANALTIVWTAQSPFNQGLVELEGPDGAKQEVEVSSDQGRYIARFDNLLPNITYRYTVANAGFLTDHAAESGPHAVRVAADRDQSIRFLAFGDSGIGSNTQGLLASLMLARKPDFIIHTGDLIYPAGAEKHYLPNFYRPYQALIASAFFMPSLGNHDVATERGAPLLRQFVLPDNGPPGIESERNYWFDYGPARFVALDSNMDANGGVIPHAAMKTTIAEWLRTALIDCDAKWRFVFFHHPFYTGSAHSADSAAYVKEAYRDAIEAAGVDIVFCGHNHLYERVASLRQDERVPDGEGVVYITTGAGGAHRYKTRTKVPDYIVTYRDDCFSFTCVELTPTKLTLRQIGENGEAFDEFVLMK